MPRHGLPPVAIIRSPRYGDMGPFEAVVQRHAYLHCFDCGERLMLGMTRQFADVFACMVCKRVVDMRRID